MLSWFNPTSSQHAGFEGHVGIQVGSEKIAALACAGRVKATIFLNNVDPIATWFGPDSDPKNPSPQV